MECHGFLTASGTPDPSGIVRTADVFCACPNLCLRWDDNVAETNFHTGTLFLQLVGTKLPALYNSPRLEDVGGCFMTPKLFKQRRTRGYPNSVHPSRTILLASLSLRCV